MHLSLSPHALMEMHCWGFVLLQLRNSEATFPKNKPSEVEPKCFYFLVTMKKILRQMFKTNKKKWERSRKIRKRKTNLSQQNKKKTNEKQASTRFMLLKSTLEREKDGPLRNQNKHDIESHSFLRNFYDINKVKLVATFQTHKYGYINEKHKPFLLHHALCLFIPFHSIR